MKLATTVLRDSCEGIFTREQGVPISSLVGGGGQVVIMEEKLVVCKELIQA